MLTQPVNLPVQEHFLRYLDALHSTHPKFMQPSRWQTAIVARIGIPHWFQSPSEETCYIIIRPRLPHGATKVAGIPLIYEEQNAEN